jgi:hypothetical protein
MLQYFMVTVYPAGMKNFKFPGTGGLEDIF